MRHNRVLRHILIAALGFLPAAAFSQAVSLGQMRLPPGFSIELLAKVPNARSLALGAKGTLFVGNRTGNAVYAVRLAGFDGKGPVRAERVLRIASGLYMPNGVAFRDGALYVAEVNRILRFDAIEDSLEAPPVPAVVFDRLPSESHHGWKFVRFGPDGWLYVPVGAPCNVCEADPDRYALILRISPDGAKREVYAHGVRNSVGLDWHPATGELWFTDNGRDMLGDDLPSDELNHAPRAGLHFGFPWCHQGDLPDPEFGRSRSCAEFTAPARKLGAHVASLGMRFYTGQMFPPEYRNRILIAEHGSWNRSSKSGYRIAVARLEGNHVTAYEPFATGWLQGESVSGRPVDLEILPDGSVAVSDDHAGAVYRIRYSKP